MDTPRNSKTWLNDQIENRSLRPCHVGGGVGTNSARRLVADWRDEEDIKILLIVEKSGTTWDAWNPVFSGINYIITNPQLVSGMSSISSMKMTLICQLNRNFWLFGFFRFFDPPSFDERWFSSMEPGMGGNYSQPQWDGWEPVFLKKNQTKKASLRFTWINPPPKLPVPNEGLG